MRNTTQLIIFPQYYDSTNPFVSGPQQFIVDGTQFTTINGLPMTVIANPVFPNFLTAYGASMTINTWYKVTNSSGVSITESGNTVTCPQYSTLIQKISGLVPGVSYDLRIEQTAPLSGISYAIYDGAGLTVITSYLSSDSSISIPFNALSSTAIIFVGNFFDPIDATITQIKVEDDIAPDYDTIDLSTGAEICDLYEEEDIPLTLSIDDFKNAGEQVQSYSKAFNYLLPKKIIKFSRIFLMLQQVLEGVMVLNFLILIEKLNVN